MSTEIPYLHITKLVGILFSMQDAWDHHGQGVADFAIKLSAEIGFSKEMIRLIGIGAQLHDIGKLLLPAELVNVPRKLTGAERARMETHAAIGWAVCEQAGYDTLVLQIVRSHHEKWDGTGYPDGLKGDSIPLPAQIVGVCDYWDALCHDRAYRKAYSNPFAKAMLEHERNQSIAPYLLDLFFKVLKNG